MERCRPGATQDALWYKVELRTKPSSGVKVALHFVRDALFIFCNDSQILIESDKVMDSFQEWLEECKEYLSALLSPEIKVRLRWTLFSGKTGAIWLDLPGGWVWKGERKAFQGSGKEFIYRGWY